MISEKVETWDHDTISDIIESMFALYGQEYIGGDTEVLRELIFMEYGYWPPLYVLNILAYEASDF